MSSGEVEDRLFEVVAAIDPDAIPLPELAAWMQRIEGWRDRLAYHGARLAAGFERRRGFEAAGCSDMVAWLKNNCRTTAGAAMERLQVGRQLAALPRTAGALEQGRIGFASAAVIARATAGVSPEQAGTLEQRTLEVAGSVDPNTLRLKAEQISCELNKEAFERDQRKAHGLRRLDFGQRPDGMVSIEGVLTQEGGATVLKAIDSLLGPAGKDDNRTPAQRRADAWVELAQLQMSGGAIKTSGTRPGNLVVSVGVEWLAGKGQMPPKLEHLYTISDEALRRLSCDSAITAVVVDGKGNPLFLGRASRTISPGQRRALNLLHPTCAWTGCDRPAGWCAGHHVDHWSKGGLTDISNLVNLCSHHHWMVHEGGWKLARGEDGTWVPVPPEAVARGPGVAA